MEPVGAGAGFLTKKNMAITHLISIGSAMEHLVGVVLRNHVEGKPFDISFGSDGTMRPFLSVTYDHKRYVFGDFNVKHFFEQLDVLEREMDEFADRYYNNPQ